ncbi:winged helix-turn-helix transcriptional regulator [Qaidamihabitans albus]|uniref:winged helix-turn-helix transcriptional regulator n=1 Tax=Qaidamihabitans albus TaxID=2795733 RepID=UPI0018F197CC|nr:winged helix-turn-helix transcriptional regulator [Qaidamihabitans albus]
MRSYDDPCGLARALDLVGERWALLVVRELLLGPKRFADLRRGLPSVSQNVLSQRLRDLETAGVLRRRVLGPPADARTYELTEHGRRLEPVLLELARWGSRTPLTSVAELSAGALVLALRTTFDQRAAAGMSATYELSLAGELLRAEVADASLEIARGRPERADAVLRADVATLRSLMFGGRALDDALRDGDIEVGGDRAAAERFLALFPRPALATAPPG